MPGKAPLIVHFVTATEYLLIGPCKLNCVLAKGEVRISPSEDPGVAD
jgi:hypothetical protein